MSRTTSRRVSFVTAVMAVFIVAVPVLAGPPWISVEYPTNPHHPSTRGASFLVRVYHHSTAITVPVTGRAEGLIGNVRKSVPLEVEPTATPGVYAVSGIPAEAGAWVAVITMSDGDAPASAVVTLGPGARVVAVDIPSDRSRDGWVIPRAATNADIETGLRQAIALGDAWDRLADAPDKPATRGAGALPALLLPLGLAVAFSRRKAKESV